MPSPQSDLQLGGLSKDIADGSLLDDYLINLAAGLAEAQAQMSRIPAKAGVPSVQYHIPRLEFELKMTFKIEQSSGGQPRLSFKPVNAVNREEAEVASVIRGAFVAAPAYNGQPTPVLRLDIAAENPRRVNLAVYLSNTAGEPLSGQNVEINVDREASVTARQREGGAAWSPRSEVAVAVLRTDAEGRASTVLTVDPADPAGAPLVVVADALGLSQSVTYRIPA